ncbi:hypothetical protein HDU67_007533 [Dinochytrium kinnereticum]|nr:hypothetical protein HDU67_007533 [Dinochytrium kinnereticum]
MNIGITSRYKQRFDFSLQALEKALKLAWDLKMRHLVKDAYCNIGLTYYSMGDLGSCIDYLEKENKLSVELDDIFGYTTTLRELGYRYMEAKCFRKALEAYKKLKSKTSRKTGLTFFGHFDMVNDIEAVQETNTAIEEVMDMVQTEYDIQSISVSISRYEAAKDFDMLFSAYKKRGALHLHLRNFQEALHDFNLLHSKSNTSKASKVFLRDVYMGIGLKYSEGFTKAMDMLRLAKLLYSCKKV